MFAKLCRGERWVFALALAAVLERREMDTPVAVDSETWDIEVFVRAMVAGLLSGNSRSSSVSAMETAELRGFKGSRGSI